MQDVEPLNRVIPCSRTDRIPGQAFARKRVFEEAHSTEKLEEVFQWTTTEEYKELNFKREALTINPGESLSAAGRGVVRAGLLQDPALRPRLAGLRGLFPHLLQPTFPRTDRRRVRFDDRRRGGVRRSENMFEGMENSKSCISRK
jgi:nitrogenase molybdenum-iron protein beta chain